MKMQSSFEIVQHCEFNDRGAWLYMITCPIGNIYVIEYERKIYHDLVRITIDGTYETANKKFETLCKKMLKGTL